MVSSLLGSLLGDQISDGLMGDIVAQERPLGSDVVICASDQQRFNNGECSESDMSHSPVSIEKPFEGHHLLLLVQRSP